MAPNAPEKLKTKMDIPGEFLEVIENYPEVGKMSTPEEVNMLFMEEVRKHPCCSSQDPIVGLHELYVYLSDIEDAEKERCALALTMDELLEQMKNPDFLPFWQMHPLVRHCIMLLFRRGDYSPQNEFVEIYDEVSELWIPTEGYSIIPDMLLSKFKATEYVDAHWVLNETRFIEWNKIHS